MRRMSECIVLVVMAFGLGIFLTLICPLRLLLFLIAALLVAAGAVFLFL